MLELRRDDLQLFFNSLLLFCVCFVLLYMGNIEFKIDSNNDSKIDSKLHPKKDSRLHSMFYNMPYLNMHLAPHDHLRHTRTSISSLLSTNERKDQSQA